MIYCFEIDANFSSIVIQLIKYGVMLEMKWHGKSFISVY